MLEGNPGRRPLPENEPQPIAGLPDCPDHLSEEAQKEWHRLGPQLVREQRMAHVYKAAFAAYCQAWGRWVEAETALKRSLPVVEQPKGSGYFVQNPLLSVSNRAWTQMMKALAELGISPTSQARVSKVKDEEEHKAHNRSWAS